MKQFKLILSVRLGLRNDLVGYETLIDYIDNNNITSLDGDFLEVGAFMGGGSAKLARYAQKFKKKVISVDIFNPNFDLTVNGRGESMAWIYNKILGKKDLYKTFKQNTKNENNIVVYHEDSKDLKLPNEIKFCFTFIDGCHDPEYAENDFNLAWNKTVRGGVVSFHDYGGALKEITNAIDRLIKKQIKNISDIQIMPEKSIIFLKKR